MLRMQPGFPGACRAANSRHRKQGALRLIAKWRSHSDSLIDASVPEPKIAALLMSTSTRPKLLIASATTLCAAATGSEKSAQTPSARRPRDAISATVASASVVECEWCTTTSAPASASAREIARPRRTAPPVTTATFPLSSTIRSFGHRPFWGTLFAPKDAGELLFREADKHHRTTANDRRPQLAARPDDVCQECLIVGRIVLHVEGDDFLPLGDDNFAGFVGQLERLARLETHLGRVDLLLDVDLAAIEKTLRFSARRAVGSVVIPIDGRGHYGSSL